MQYLCSDAAAYVNGQVLAVDGGFVISGINAADAAGKIDLQGRTK